MKGKVGMDRAYLALGRALADGASGVSRELAAGDAMFGGDEARYFAVGQSALHCIAASLTAAGVASPRRILDLPCGHGRVLRVLRRAFPDAALAACDLDRDGVDFCAAQFGATPVHSHADLGQVRFDAPFDLIWCGSLVTHLDAAGWLAWFRLLSRALQPGGVAVVTFHGRWAAHRMQNGHSYGLAPAGLDAVLSGYAHGGFGSADYPGQGGYGISLSAPSWILRELAPWPQFRVVGLMERQWDEHQDVLAVQRL